MRKEIEKIKNIEKKELNNGLDIWFVVVLLIILVVVLVILMNKNYSTAFEECISKGNTEDYCGMMMN